LNLDGLLGGETVTLSVSNIGSCDKLSVEIVEARDPCAKGMHQCDHLATCTPTADGMDYTCACQTCQDCDPNWYKGPFKIIVVCFVKILIYQNFYF